MKCQLFSTDKPVVSDIPEMRTFVSHSWNLKAFTEFIVDLWCIGIRESKETLEATNQKIIRSAILPLIRRYITDIVYSLKRLNSRFANDTLFSDIK